MTSALTYVIEEKENVTLREFALRCARGMTMCGHQRDEDINNPPRPPRPREASDYYIKSVIEASEKLAEIVALSDDQLRKRMLKKRQEADDAEKETLREYAILGARYLKLRAEVVAWQPPGKDLAALKTYMLDQIDASYEQYDPKKDRSHYRVAPMTVQEYRAMFVKMYKSDIERYTVLHEEEVRGAIRSAERIKALYASLP